jgi:hypothetical protein
MKTQESEFLLIKLFRNTNPYQKKKNQLLILFICISSFIHNWKNL